MHPAICSTSVAVLVAEQRCFFLFIVTSEWQRSCMTTKEVKPVTSDNSFNKIKQTRHFKGQLFQSWLESYSFCLIQLLAVQSLNLCFDAVL